MENESQVLESQIHIQIRPDHPSPTLICAHENGCTDSITLRVLGKFCVVINHTH